MQSKNSGIKAHEPAGLSGLARLPMGISNAHLLAIALCCLFAVCAAFASQHIFNMQPCPWCVLQRVIFLLIAFFCGLALMARGYTLRLSLSAVALVFSLTGIAAAVQQHVSAANAFSCGLSLADKIIRGLSLDRLAPAMFAPQTSCADGAVNLFGIPYEFWSLALFLIFTAVLMLMTMQAAKRKKEPNNEHDAFN